MRDTVTTQGAMGAGGFNFSKIEAFLIKGNDSLLKDREAASVYNCSRSRFWAGVKSGEFPPPKHIGGMTRWSNNICQADVRRRFADQLGEAA